MKKFFVLCVALFATSAFSHIIDWYVDGQIYQTTTCQSGDSITPPTPPAKYGYTFRGWQGLSWIEYIESTGTQYIDTGIVPNADTRITATYYMVSNSSSYPMVFGSIDGTALPQFSLYAFNNQMFYTFGRKTNGDNDIQMSTTPFNTLHAVDCNKNVFTLDGTSKVGSNSVDINIQHSLYVFCRNFAGVSVDNCSSMKLYNFKIWNNDTLVRDMVPAKNAIGVVGMYDTVNGEFYTNQGTGTFTAGTAVSDPVEVYADGLIETIGVSQLPVAYRELEYISATGTQYIDTGYKSSNNTKVKAQISCPNFGTFVFGSRNSTSGDNQKRFGLFFNTTWNPQYANQSLSPAEQTSVNTIYNVEISKDGFVVDGQSLSTFSSTTFTGDYNMYLFANNTADTNIGYGSCKIYSFEIYTNNVLAHKYIPAKNSSNVVGMYDTVSRTFFTNQGTGDFVAGPTLGGGE